MTTPVQFWFDFASTYSYLTAMRLERVAAAKGISVEWHPFLLGPIFQAQGWNDSPFNLYPAKGRYMWRDMERLCAAAGLPWRRPSVFPRNGLLPARVACHFASEPWTPEFARAVFRANFVEDLDISQPEVVARCLEQAGQIPGALLASAQSAQAKAGLRDQTSRAAELGIFGAPWFKVGTEMFWGHDRLDQALAWSECQGV